MATSSNSGIVAIVAIVLMVLIGGFVAYRVLGNGGIGGNHGGEHGGRMGGPN